MTAAQKLRELADELDAANKRLALPRESYTLDSALAALGAALPPDRNYGIDLEVKRYTFDRDLHVEWMVWDGLKSHNGGSLSAALAACLAANRPGDTLDTAQAALGVPADDVVPLGVNESPTLGEPATAAL